MNRQELIEEMAMIGRAASVRASNPETYWADLDESSKSYERRQAEAVLDLLTKEARLLWIADSGYTTSTDMADGDSARSWREIQAIILDLPSAPSATKRAMVFLRAYAECDIGKYDAAEIREIADELEKEANRATNGS